MSNLQHARDLRGQEWPSSPTETPLGRQSRRHLAKRQAPGTELARAHHRRLLPLAGLEVHAVTFQGIAVRHAPDALAASPLGRECGAGTGT